MPGPTSSTWAWAIRTCRRRPMCIEKLKETLGKPRTDRYSASRGINGLRKAQAAYYGRRFGVKLNPDTQIVATLGSKEGFANVAQAITAPGDVVLCPESELSDSRLRLPDGGRRDPLGALGADAAVFRGGGTRDRPFDPEAARARSSAIPPIRPPMSPSLDFYKDLVAFAKKHEIFILSDLAYAEVYFDDNNPPPSVLQVPGAIDVTVEFTSMSKTFSMAGWRDGVCRRQRADHRRTGAGEILSRLRRVHADSGRRHRRAERAGRLHPAKCATPTASAATRWSESFGRAGWEIPPPQASMFAWAPLPKAFEGVGSMQFATLMVEKSGVVVSPGVAFGEHGEGLCPHRHGGKRATYPPGRPRSAPLP